MPGRALRSLSSLTVAALLLGACATLDDEPAPRSIVPLAGFGSSSFAVTARDEQARAWFAHGLQLTYAFEHGTAARVFRAAWARDPSCAMCAWGVAYALGPNINNSDRGPVRDIRRYIARAQQAAAGASPVERALIDAMAVRYGNAAERDQKAYEALGAAMCSSRKAERPVDPQELGYAAAMADVVRRFPGDPDVVALYADAVMSTMPWDWWDRKTGQANGAAADVISRLATAARAHPQHTGVLHFFVHLAEHSPEPTQAEAAADGLALTAPASPHLVHMGSHIYKNVGRFADGSRANQQAMEVQKRFDAALKAQDAPRGVPWDGHHLHFLWYAALMEGRTALALATARDYASRFGAARDGFGEYARLLPLATLVRLQRWDEVLAEPTPAGGLGLLEGYGAFARGMAQAHTGRLADAKAEWARLETLRAQPTAKRASIWGEPVPQKMLTLASDTLAGTIARAEGRHPDAVALLRKAADTDDELGSDPPLLGGGTRTLLAAALIQAGRADEAGKEIAEALRLNGPSTWTHLSQAQLAQARGARSDSLRHAELARQAWRNADVPRLPQL